MIPAGNAARFSGDYITVSEGTGYGMLPTVVMAGHDPEARALFDALLTIDHRPRSARLFHSCGGRPTSWIGD
jgi:hypothetical protein